MASFLIITHLVSPHSLRCGKLLTHSGQPVDVVLEKITDLSCSLLKETLLPRCAIPCLRIGSPVVFDYGVVINRLWSAV
jgi:hypothetical protein